MVRVEWKRAQISSTSSMGDVWPRACGLASTGALHGHGRRRYTSMASPAAIGSINKRAPDKRKSIGPSDGRKPAPAITCTYSPERPSVELSTGALVDDSFLLKSSSARRMRKSESDRKMDINKITSTRKQWNFPFEMVFTCIFRLLECAIPLNLTPL